VCRRGVQLPRAAEWRGRGGGQGECAKVECSGVYSRGVQLPRAVEWRGRGGGQGECAKVRCSGVKRCGWQGELSGEAGAMDRVSVRKGRGAE